MATKLKLNFTYKDGGGDLARIIALLVALAAAFALFWDIKSYADRELRMLLHEKGVYLGPPDAAIADDTLQDLRHRAGRQRY